MSPIRLRSPDCVPPSCSAPDSAKLASISASALSVAPSCTYDAAVQKCAVRFSPVFRATLAIFANVSRAAAGWPLNSWSLPMPMYDATKFGIDRERLVVHGDRLVEASHLHEQLGIRVIRVGVVGDQLDVFLERGLGLAVLAQEPVGVAHLVVRLREATR